MATRKRVTYTRDKSTRNRTSEDKPASTDRRRTTRSDDAGDRKPKRDFGDKPTYKKDFGSRGADRGDDTRKKRFDDSKDFGDRRPKRDFGDKPAYKKDFGSRGADRGDDTRKKRFDDSKDFGDRRPKRDFGDKPAYKKDFGSRGADRGDDTRKKRFDDSKDFGDRRPKRDFGDKPTFKKDFGSRGSDRSDDTRKKRFDDSKDFGDRKPKRDFGDKPTFKKDFGSRGSDRGDDTKKKRFDDSKDFGDRRPKRDFGDKPTFKKDFGSRGADRSDDTRKKRFDDSKDFGDRKPKRDFGDKPTFKKDFGDKKRSSGDGDRGFEKKDSGYSDRGSSRSSKGGYEKKSYAGKGYSDKKKGKSKSAEPEASDGLIRLNKYISNAGICSRREADEFITSGLVSVNGKIVTELGTKVSIDDTVKYNGETLRKEKFRYVILNKPKDYITTTDDPDQRHTVMELIAKACRERIYPVGRLDRNTTGLLLFTNDGELADKLMHPRTEVRKIYHVELDKTLKQSDFEKITNGMELEDGFIKPDEIAYDVTTDSKRVIGITLHSGRNRIVRRIFEELGYEVKKLDRVYYAGLTKKDLPRGRFRHLTEMELNMLKMVNAKTQK